MPSTSTSVNPLGIKIEFDEASHSYTSNVNNKNITYTSVTSLVGQYFKQFDALKVAGNVAKKRGVSVESIIAEWDTTRNEANAYGTRIHQIAEDTIKGIMPRHNPANNKEIATFKYTVEAALKLKDRFTVIDVEKIVFDHRLKIAGTIDLLLKYDDTYLIVDWKSNKEISDENKYSEFGLGPLSSLADTSLNHYALQLSLYEYILRYAEYIPKDAVVKRVLMHVTPFGVNKIPLDYMKDYVKDLLIDYLLSNLK